jgi:hypothetical protein
MGQQGISRDRKSILLPITNNHPVNKVNFSPFLIQYVLEHGRDIGTGELTDLYNLSQGIGKNELNTFLCPDLNTLKNGILQDFFRAREGNKFPIG